MPPVRRSSIRRRSTPSSDASPPSEGARPLSLEELLVLHGDFVRRSLARAGVPPAGVDDAAQQVFIVVASKLASVSATRERAFLLGIVLNVAAHARRGFVRRREVDDEDVASMLDDGPLPDDRLDAQRLADVVDRALAALPPDLRDVLVLVDVEEHTMADVAALLGIPAGTVASRLRRARELTASAIARARPSRRLRAARRRIS